MAEGCCTLGCAAKTVGWLQLVLSIVGILMQLAIITTTQTLDVQEDGNETMVRISDESIKNQQKETNETTGKSKAIFSIVYLTIVGALAIGLLLGIRRNKPKWIWYWLIANAVSITIVVVSVIIQLFIILLWTDTGSLTMTISSLVIHCLQVWVVYKYHQEMKEEPIPASY